MDKKYKDVHILLNHKELYCYRQVTGNITIFSDRIEIFTDSFVSRIVDVVPFKIVILLPLLNGISVVVD